MLFLLESSGRKISVNDLDEELCKVSSEKRHIERLVSYKEPTLFPRKISSDGSRLAQK